MILINVSFGFYAFMPQGWIFMLLIVLIESLIVSRVLAKEWFVKLIYLKVAISNALSGIVGIVISMFLNGGWWLVIWIPWVSENEVDISSNQLYGLMIYYGLAFVLTLLIEIPSNILLFNKYRPRQVILSTIYANLISYSFGTLIFYGYSFNLR